MALVSVLVLGGIAWSRLPLAFLPEVDAPFIGVQVPYPNSNPTQIEKEITKPVEEALSTLSGIKKLRSRSTADEAEINMQFDWGEDLDIVRMQVSEKMEQVKPTLPAGIGQVLIFSFSTSDIPVVEGRIAAKGVDLSKNYDLLETRIANRIRRVAGVARVDLEGVAPREISIELVLDKIKAHNVDVGALIAGLQGASQNLVLGQVDSGGLRYTARALGAFGSVEAIEDLPVGDGNNRGLRLKDIAEVVYEEPPSGIGRHLEGEYAVAVNVYKESTANTVEVAKAVHKVISEDIGKDPLLKGVQLFVFEDQAKQITNAIDGLTQSGALGGVLAVLVLYFFLRRLDSTLIVSLSIPFSVIAACGVMYFMGMTLNILSMMGLMLGVGMLVDNAIVVLESIDRKQREERDAKKAALEGASHVWLAVTSSTATTLIVFLPLIVGASNQLTIFLKEVGISLSLAMIASLFSSLTLIPLVSAHYLKVKKPKPVRSVMWLEDRYASMLGWTLGHRKTTLLLVVLGLASGFVPFMLELVPTGMFSANANERLHIDYQFADFSYKSDSERAVNQVEKFINANRKRFLVEELYSYYRENEAGTIISLTRKDLTDPEMQELRTKLREGLPKIAGVKLSFDDESAEAGGSSTFFAVKFFGQDSEVLGRLAAEAERRLATVQGVEDITSPIHRGRREIQVKVDRDKAMKLGMTAQDISDLFSFTLGGMRLRRFNTGDHEVE
ncbi:MAG TPA: efflux RND transporter permease subunit, partial [Thermoanaerobaculia bacterium]|nr:efflux RND transporter permease subunit [Thermoanaerobaculia bacterium]